MLLTEIQKNRLTARNEKKENELEAYKKRHNDQVVLDKFGEYIESIPDVLLILKHMPVDKIATKLRSEHIPLILDLVEALLSKIDPWAVSEDTKSAFKTVGVSDPDDPPGKCRVLMFSRPANPEEIAICDRLKDHYKNLQHYFDPYSVDPIYRDLDDFGKLKDFVREGISISSIVSDDLHPGSGLIDESELKQWKLNPRELLPKLVSEKSGQENGIAQIKNDLCKAGPYNDLIKGSDSNFNERSKRYTKRTNVS